MSETTQEERDRLRDRTTGRKDTNTFLRHGALLRLLNDADRLAELEQQLRDRVERIESAAADNVKTADESAVSSDKAAAYWCGMASAQGCDARLLRVLLDPPTEHHAGAVAIPTTEVGEYVRQDLCPECDGSGEVAGDYFSPDGMNTCRSCGGTGRQDDESGDDHE